MTIEDIKEYINKGFEIIPLKPFSKVPILKKWSKEWNKKLCFIHFNKDNFINLGLKLGKIIDIEGDSEEANESLFKLIGDYKHPYYTTNNRSYHHLFLNPFDIRLIKKNHIEIRGYGHQSVIPPSVVEGEYKWIEKNNLIVPKVPLSILNYIKGNYSYNYKGEYSWKEQVENIKLNKSKFIKPKSTLKKCNSCGKYFPINKRRFVREAMAYEKLGFKWNCKSCSEVDIRKFVKK